MSTQAMQQALAFLIRLPESNRDKDLESFIARFDLSAIEKRQIAALSRDPLVYKYGKLMVSARETKMTSLLKLSSSYLPENVLKQIWEMWFEPSATKVTFNELPSAFLKFLLESPEASQILSTEAPPFVSSMLRFEAAQAQFRMKHFSHPRKVPEGSRLVHADFVVLKLDYDIQGLRARLLKDKEGRGTLVPEQRPVTLLFIRKDSSFECRIFEIDDSVKQFLEGELESPPRHHAQPDSYDVLVKLGLCQPEI